MDASITLDQLEKNGQKNSHSLSHHLYKGRNSIRECTQPGIVYFNPPSRHLYPFDFGGKWVRIKHMYHSYPRIPFNLGTKSPSKFM